MLSMLCHFMIRVKSICSFYLMLMLYYGTPHYMMHVSVSPNVCHSVSASFTFSLGPSSVGVGAHASGLWLLTLTHWLLVEKLFLHSLLAPDFAQTFWEWRALGYAYKTSWVWNQKSKGKHPKRDVYDVDYINIAASTRGNALLYKIRGQTGHRSWTTCHEKAKLEIYPGLTLDSALFLP